MTIKCLLTNGWYNRWILWSPGWESCVCDPSLDPTSTTLVSLSLGNYNLLHHPKQMQTGYVTGILNSCTSLPNAAYHSYYGEKNWHVWWTGQNKYKWISRAKNVDIWWAGDGNWLVKDYILHLLMHSNRCCCLKEWGAAFVLVGDLPTSQMIHYLYCVPHSLPGSWHLCYKLSSTFYRFRSGLPDKCLLTS